MEFTLKKTLNIRDETAKEVVVKLLDKSMQDIIYENAIFSSEVGQIKNYQDALKVEKMFYSLVQDYLQTECDKNPKMNDTLLRFLETGRYYTHEYDNDLPF
jgi:hypothetical protein